MTAADKLAELLATRPAMPSMLELVRWWNSGADVLQLIADLQRLEAAGDRDVEMRRLNQLLVDTQAKFDKRERDLRAELERWEQRQLDVVVAAAAFCSGGRSESELVKAEQALLRAVHYFIDDESRCAVCAWPLKASIADGCTRGNCSQRPRAERLYAPARAEREFAALCAGKALP